VLPNPFYNHDLPILVDYDMCCLITNVYIVYMTPITFILLTELRYDELRDFMTLVV
jgi:hypothetical protein